MILNELAQWAGLIFLGVFVLGLTRQLGRFMVQRSGDIAEQVGPPVGKPLPRSVLPQADRARMRELIRSSAGRYGAVFVVDEDCPGCEEFLKRLERGELVDGTPLAALSRVSSPAHRLRLERLFDLVVVDAERLKRADLRVTPFLLRVDEELRVTHKALTGSLRDALSQWERGTSEEHDVDGSAGRPVVVQAGGREQHG